MRDGDYTATVTFLGKFFEFTEGVVELRAIRNQGGAYPPAFVSSASQIIAYCQSYDVPGSAVYFGCCTRALSANRGRREDLWQCIALWVDIDCLKLGLLVADVVAALLACPLPPSLIVMSGGGLHAYWHLTEPLSAVPAPPGEPDTVREEVEAALRQLAGVFCGDDNACDLPRVLRPAGTHNSKLPELRPVTVLWPEGLLTDPDVYIDRRYEFSDIVETLDWLGPVIESPVTIQSSNNRPDKGDQADPFLAFAEKYRFKPPLDVEAAIRDMSLGGGETGIHRTQLKVSASLLAAGMAEDDIVRFLLEQTQRAAGLAGERWNWKREEKNLYGMIATWRERLKKEGKAPPEQPRVAVTDGKIVQLRPREQAAKEEAAAEARPQTAAQAAPIGEVRNDIGNALQLLALHRTHLCYVAESGWHIWDGKRFCRDNEMLAAHRMAHDVSATQLDAALRITDKAAIKWAVSSGTKARISAMLHEARSYVARKADDMDANIWLLNCQNGTLDLRDGTLRPHTPADLITKICGTAYDPEARCPRWEAFLVEIFDGDQEMIRFVQYALGYSLTGSVRENVFFILHGTGKNGKSKLLEAMAWVLGDYMLSTPADTWATKPAGAPSNDVAALPSARFVTTTETEKSHSLRAGLVKQITGGDKVSARKMFKEFFEFMPQCKLWIATNNKPKVSGSDGAIWDRIRLLPFNIKFVPREELIEGQKVRDNDLMDKLLVELPGILAWMVRGCTEWQRSGLPPAVAMTEAVEDYRASQDSVQGFVDQCCDASRGLTCAVKDLYAAYEIWGAENDEEILSKKAFGSNLDERGYPPGRLGRVRFRKRIDLKGEWREAVKAAQNSDR